VSGTSLIVTDATVFPAAPFQITIWPVNVNPTKTNAEVARVTAIVSNTLTITRAQETTTARAIVVGDQVANTISTKPFTDLEALAAATSTITTTGTSTALAIPTGSGPLFIFANNGSTLTIQGIAAGGDGQRLHIFSIGGGNVVVQHNNAGASAAANKILCEPAQDFTLTAGVQSAAFTYDATAARWRQDNILGLFPVLSQAAGDIFYATNASAGIGRLNGTGLVQLNGASAPTLTTAGWPFTYTGKTGTYGAVAGDYVDCTANTFAVTLPAASSNANKAIIVVNSGAGTITIAHTGSDVVGNQGETSQTLNPGDSMTFTSGGAGNLWRIS